uniref:mannosyl-glycoprotein endo-beta-N-acetylglucosaminidase n=1 Tax=Saccoglossus kowalevskii TaxID=10224 RepID=A0ABM0MUP1_SACKO|nr:PREDICTED: cytosolic endo-beta-N-acetylglucosaminidase-like [Saccoglossus kowalevskii]
MSVISNHKLSAAIFAPGWVCEKHGHEHFVENQNRFWNLLSEFCTPNVISCLPIVTSFCHGCGTKYYRHGQVIKNKPWGNLSCQQLQPNIVNSAEDITVDYCTMDAYHGGGCLEVTGKLKSDKYTTLGIFSSSIKVDHPLLVSYTYQMIADEKDVGFCLYLRCDGGQKIISLVSDQEVGERQSQSTVSDYGIDFSDKLFNSSLPCMTDISQHSSVYATLSGDSQISLQATFHGEDISTSSKWKTRYYLVPSEEFNNDIQEIALCCYARKKEDVSSVDFTFKLGYLQIVNPISLINNSKEVSDLQLSDDQWTESTDADRNALVSGTLKWNYPSTSGVHFNIFCVGLKTDPHDNTEIDTSSRVFIGQAFVNMYRICDLCVSSGKADTPYSFKVIVQPVNNAGFTTPFKNCSTLTVNHTL